MALVARSTLDNHATWNVAGPNGNNAFEFANKNIPDEFIIGTCMFMDHNAFDVPLSELLTQKIRDLLVGKLVEAKFTPEQVDRVKEIMREELSTMASRIFTSKFMKEARVISLPDRSTNSFRSAWTARNPWEGPEKLIDELVKASVNKKLGDLKKSKYKVIPDGWENGHEVQILYMLIFDLICAHLVDSIESVNPGVKAHLEDVKKSLCADVDKSIVDRLSLLALSGTVVHAQEVRGTQLKEMEKNGFCVSVSTIIRPEYIQYTTIILPRDWKLLRNVSDQVYKKAIVYAKERMEAVPDAERLTAIIASDMEGRVFFLVSAHAGSGGESALAMTQASIEVYNDFRRSHYADMRFVMGIDSNAETGPKVSGLHRDGYDVFVKSMGMACTEQIPTMKRARLAFQAQPLKRSVVVDQGKISHEGIQGDLEYMVEEHAKDVIVVGGMDDYRMKAFTFNRISPRDHLCYLEDVMCPDKLWPSDHFALSVEFCCKYDVPVV